MDSLADICAILLIAVKDLLVIINGSSHGVLQGTHEAVLLEAQGGQIGAAGFNHLASLQATLRDVTAREGELNRALGLLRGVLPGVEIRVRAILDPLLRQSASYRSAMVQTEQMAGNLAQSDGTRLSGVVFGEGGAGGEVGRSAKALISTQMQQRSQELTDRGIEPRLIPAARNAGAQVMATIRELPITIRDAKEKVISVISAINILLRQAAQAALVAGRAALSAALTALDAALVEAGSRLTTPFIFLNTPTIRRAMGLPVDDEA